MFILIPIEIFLIEIFKFYRHEHLCTVHMHRRIWKYLRYSLFGSYIYLFSFFSTFMSISPLIFVTETLNFLNMCLYVLCMCILLIWIISQMFVIWPPFLCLFFFLKLSTLLDLPSSNVIARLLVTLINSTVNKYVAHIRFSFGNIE